MQLTATKMEHLENKLCHLHRKFLIATVVIVIRVSQIKDLAKKEERVGWAYATLRLVLVKVEQVLRVPVPKARHPQIPLTEIKTVKQIKMTAIILKLMTKARPTEDSKSPIRNQMKDQLAYPLLFSSTLPQGLISQ